MHAGGVDDIPWDRLPNGDRHTKRKDKDIYTRTSDEHNIGVQCERFTKIRHSFYNVVIFIF